MRVPVSWLREYVSFDLPPRELGERLSLTGTKLEALHRRGVPRALERYRVGRVITREQHPNADRLTLCSVDIGTGEPQQIVCGARNFEAGATVAVALPGAVLPDGTELRVAKLQGLESHGMMLSERELDLGQDHDGIMLLPGDWPYTVNAVSGYSGGGKSLIGRFEADPDIAFRAYGLGFGHKHLPEMQQVAGITREPVFAPSVIPAHRGMLCEVPLPLAAMPGAGAPEAMRAELTQFYAGSLIVRMGPKPDGELLLRRSAEPSDAMDLYVFASPDGSQARLVAVLDNLGKGASGAAVQNLNLMAGLDETAGLRL